MYQKSKFFAEICAILAQISENFKKVDQSKYQICAILAQILENFEK